MTCLGMGLMSIAEMISNHLIDFIYDLFIYLFSIYIFIFGTHVLTVFVKIELS